MNKVALITGASSGIGKEMARIHAAQGGDIIAVALGMEALQTLKNELENEYKIQVHLIDKDLSRTEAAQEIYAEVKGLGVEVEYLINNAGFGGVGNFHERPWAKDLAMIQVNVIAVAALTRCFLPDFIARDRGRILNTSSTVSLIPGPGQAVYFASKAFVTSFSHSLYGELADSGVSVTALLPGPTETGFGDHSGMSKTSIYDKTASAAEVARDGYEAMMQGELQVISGLSLSEKAKLKMVPLLPKKAVIEQVRKGQETH